jgi:hypothetical protein
VSTTDFIDRPAKHDGLGPVRCACGYTRKHWQDPDGRNYPPFLKVATADGTTVLAQAQGWVMPRRTGLWACPKCLTVRLGLKSPLEAT